MSPSADTVARAIVSAARVYRQDPLKVLLGDRQYGKARIVAGAVLVRAGVCSAAVAARLCGAPTAQKLAPTGRHVYGIDEADFERAVELAGLQRPAEMRRPRSAAALSGRGGGNLQQPQMDAVEAYLRSVADKDGCVRGKTYEHIGVGSGVPRGSVSFAVLGLEAAKRLTVSKAFRPGTRAPAPNSYWLMPAQVPPAAPEPPTRPKRPATDPVFAAAFEPRQRATSSSVAPAPIRQEALSQRPVTPISGDDFETADRAKGPAVLTSLGRGQCRWPLENSPTGVDQLYCAADCDDGQYCKGHLARMWAKPPKREAKPLGDAERQRRSQVARDRRSA